MNCQMFKLYLEKAEEPDIKLPTFIESSRKQENSRKTSTLLYWLQQAKYLSMWITTNCGNCGKLLRRWEYQTSYLPLEKLVFRSWRNVRTRHGTKEWFQIGKGIHKVCMSPCLFNLYSEYMMQNVMLDEAQAGIKIAGRNIKTSDMQMTPPLWQKMKRN